MWITIYLGSIDRLGRIGTAHTDFPEQETHSAARTKAQRNGRTAGHAILYVSVVMRPGRSRCALPGRASPPVPAARRAGGGGGCGGGGEVPRGVARASRAAGPGARGPVPARLVVRCCVCVVCSVAPAGLVPSQLLDVRATQHS